MTVASVGIEAHHVGAEADAGRQERHAPRRGLQAEQEHALVELGRLHRARLAGVAEVRLERDRVERHERVHDLAHLAGPAQQADVGPAVRTIVRSRTGERRSARTIAIGLRRDPQPPIPTVMPSRTRATTSSIVTRLSGTGTRCSWSICGASSRLDVGRSDGASDRTLRPRDRSRRVAALRRAVSCSSPAGAAASGGASRSASPTRARDVAICCRHEPEDLPDGLAVRRRRRARARAGRRGDRGHRRALRRARRAGEQRGRLAAGRHRDRVAAVHRRDHRAQPHRRARVRAEGERGDAGAGATAAASSTSRA